MAFSAETSVLLRNVALIDPDEPAEQMLVNILIVGGELDVLTEDPVGLEVADQSFDAAGAVILGRLALGEPANFMLLDGDPREDVNVLLDTKAYGLFAMRHGEVVLNRLDTITDEARGDRAPSGEGWLAYSPPPLAVPLDYRNRGKFNRFDTSPVSGIFAAGILLDRTYWVDQSANSRLQVGDLSAFDGGEIRGFRLGGVGTLNFERPWVWTLFGATHAFDKGYDKRESNDFSWIDVRLDIPLWEKTSFSVGKQKEPISMERLMSMAYLPLQERSAPADGLLPSRNVGVVMSSPMFEERVVVAGGAFNNWLERDQPNSFSDNAMNYVGRGTWVPFEDATSSRLLHLGAGFRYSDAKEGVRFGTSPEIDLSPNFIDTGLLKADRMRTYQAEASWRSGRLWVHGEWICSDIDAPELRDPSVTGHSLMASWTLSGEVRDYNKRLGVFKPLRIARSVSQNGWGAWELAARYSNLDANDALLDSGEMDIWSAGVNWWLSPYLNLSVNYRYITLDQGGIEGASQAINTRIVLGLE